MGALAWILVVVLGASAWGGEDCAASVPSVDAALDAAEGRVLDADALGFEREVVRVRAEVACLAEPATVDVSARVHRVLGLWSWAHREDERALASLRAARLLAPDHALSDALFPAGDPLRSAHEEADPSLAPVVQARLPRGRLVWFDGTLTRDRPADRPTLVQVAGRDGRPDVAAVVGPDERLPVPRWVAPARRALGISAGVLAAVAGGLYGGAWAARASFDGRRADEIAALRSDQSAANGLAVGAAVALAGALGTGAGALGVR